MRRVALAALALSAALVAAPAAGAWTTLSGGVQNIVVPSMIVTQAGTELVSFESPNGGTISVSRNGGAPKVIVAERPDRGRTQLVQQPNGAIQLYFPNAAGRRADDLDRRRRLVDGPDPDAVAHRRRRDGRALHARRDAALLPGRDRLRRTSSAA